MVNKNHRRVISLLSPHDAAHPVYNRKGKARMRHVPYKWNRYSAKTYLYKFKYPDGTPMCIFDDEAWVKSKAFNRGPSWKKWEDAREQASGTGPLSDYERLRWAQVPINAVWTIPVAAMELEREIGVDPSKSQALADEINAQAVSAARELTIAIRMYHTLGQLIKEELVAYVWAPERRPRFEWLWAEVL